MSLIVYNACKAMKLLIITWVYICISFNTWIWLIQKNDKIDILSLIFMPFTGNKSPGAKKGSDEWQCENFTNIFWVKRTFNMILRSRNSMKQFQPNIIQILLFIQNNKSEYFTFTLFKTFSQLSHDFLFILYNTQPH